MKKGKRVKVKNGLMKSFPSLFTGVQTDLGTVQSLIWESGLEVVFVEFDCGTIKKLPAIFLNLITPN